MIGFFDIAGIKVSYKLCISYVLVKIGKRLPRNLELLGSVQNLDTLLFRVSRIWTHARLEKCWKYSFRVA